MDKYLVILNDELMPKRNRKKLTIFTNRNAVNGRLALWEAGVRISQV